MYQSIGECTDPFLLDLRQTFMPRASENDFAFIPARTQQLVPVPARLRIGPLRHLFQTDPRLTGGIRTHHAAANHLLEKGINPIITTGTGSGKSLIFMLEALHTVMSNPDAHVVALYPTRALNADQMGKWRDLLEQLGLSQEMLVMLDGSTPNRRTPDAAAQRAHYHCNAGCLARMDAALA